jgi:hypothetical protein
MLFGPPELGIRQFSVFKPFRIQATPRRQDSLECRPGPRRKIWRVESSCLHPTLLRQPPPLTEIRPHPCEACTQYLAAGVWNVTDRDHHAIGSVRDLGYGEPACPCPPARFSSPRSYIIPDHVSRRNKNGGRWTVQTIDLVPPRSLSSCLSLHVRPWWTRATRATSCCATDRKQGAYCFYNCQHLWRA